MRLIDADEAKKYLYEHFDDLHMIAAQNAIDEMPTIDAQPVKRGRWIPIDETTAECSVCGWWQRTNGKDKTGKALIHNAAYMYCTVCGACMRGEEDEQAQ